MQSDLLRCDLMLGDKMKGQSEQREEEISWAALLRERLWKSSVIWPSVWTVTKAPLRMGHWIYNGIVMVNVIKLTKIYNHLGFIHWSWKACPLWVVSFLMQEILEVWGWRNQDSSYGSAFKSPYFFSFKWYGQRSICSGNKTHSDRKVMVQL